MGWAFGLFIGPVPFKYILFWLFPLVLVCYLSETQFLFLLYKAWLHKLALPFKMAFRKFYQMVIMPMVTDSQTAQQPTATRNGRFVLPVVQEVSQYLRSICFHIDTFYSGVYDRKRAIHDMAKNEDVDVITGDWMSEANMTLRGSDKREKLGSGTLVGKAYEPYFLEELDPAIPWLAKRGVKIAVNAGASDVQGLAEAVKLLVKKHGVDLKVGYVDGDDVTDAVLDLYKKGKTMHILGMGYRKTNIEPGEKFLNLPANKNIQEWGYEPLCAQCYLGGTGIAACFEGGADIVVCGRVADASVTVGAAMWWHGWKRETHVQELAGALMIGHIIECSTYATGGYYSGFKDLGIKDTDMGYPIAAINEKGEAVITMEKGKHGLCTPATIASQLLYEIQGDLYYNSDVTASLRDIKLESVGENAVKVSGVKGSPPPPTTKGKSSVFEAKVPPSC